MATTWPKTSGYTHGFLNGVTASQETATESVVTKSRGLFFIFGANLSVPQCLISAFRHPKLPRSILDGGEVLDIGGGDTNTAVSQR